MAKKRDISVVKRARYDKNWQSEAQMDETQPYQSLNHHQYWFGTDL